MKKIISVVINIILYGALIALFLCFHFGLLFWGVVPTGSMYPTIDSGCIYVAVNKDLYQRGDIVIFNIAEDKDVLCKRIVGLPGEKIIIQNDKVYINGEELGEEYLPSCTKSIPVDKTTYEIPDNCYFMMGDNRINSYDSRYWTNPFVNDKDILAKMITHVYLGKLSDQLATD